jgi:AcrR family transcriptional regulator
VRRERARARLTKATVAMIAERGLPGLTFTKVGARAGVSRALAGYHFKNRGELIQQVVSSLLDDETARPEGLGLEPLLGWMDSQIRRVAEKDVELLALLQVAIGPGVEREASALREAYWGRRTHLVEHHLNAAQALGQIRRDLAPSQLAPILLGQLHGELLRIAATGAPPADTFSELIRRALTPERLAPKGGQKAPA